MPEEISNPAVQESSGKVKQTIVNTITVKRTAEGITLTIFAPEVHKWLKGRMELVQISSCYDGRSGWPSEGRFLYTETGSCPVPLQKYQACVLWVGSNSEAVNLAILRHEKAETEPVSVTFPGLFGFEVAQKVLKVAQETLVSLYSDYMREYFGTAKVTITR